MIFQDFNDGEAFCSTSNVKCCPRLTIKLIISKVCQQVDHSNPSPEFKYSVNKGS